MLPSISIVLPAFNEERYVAAAVESVLAQDYPALEVIVVDDGSTDATGEIVDHYADRCVVVHQSNRGQSAALTRGWAHATGEFLGYLGADDRLLPGAAGRLSSALAAHTNVVLAYPDFNIIDEHGQARRIVRPAEFSRRELYAGLNCMPGPGALFRRDAYLAAGPWRDDLHQIPDLEFYLRLAENGGFVRVPEVLADFRRHAGSTTYSIVPPDRAEEPISAVEDFLKASTATDVAGWSDAMMAQANLLSAILHGQSGRRGEAVKRVRQAMAHHPAALFTPRGRSLVSTLVRGTLLPPRFIGTDRAGRAR